MSLQKALGACFVSLLLLSCGCKKTTPSSSTNETTTPLGAAKLDACTLLTRDEITAIQGSPIKEAKGSDQANRGFRIAQCFYTASEFSKSVVLSVTQRDPANPGQRTPRDFWAETFGENPEREKERERDREEGEKAAPPKKIEGAGDEAYWVGSGGALYVLKNDVFIRISIGGGDTEEDKISKSKKLALKALERL